MKGKLKAKLSMNGLQLEIASDNPADIRKLSKLIRQLKGEEALKIDETPEDDIYGGLFDDFYELRSCKYTRKNKEATAFIEKHKPVEEAMRQKNANLPYCLNLSEKKIEAREKDIKKAFAALFSRIPENKVSVALLHIICKSFQTGAIEREFERRIPNARIKVIKTDAKLPKILLEAVFFGDFPAEIGDEYFE